MIDLEDPPEKRYSCPKIKEDASDITLNQLKGCVSLKMRRYVTQDMVDLVNSACDDTDERNNFRENLLSWSSVLSEGKWKFADYVCAVKYVSHKMLGDGNTMAWAKVFPNRFDRLVNKGSDSKTIAAHASQYNNNDLVRKLIERTLVPIWLTNSDILQEAINKQAELMRNARSETVQHKAANSLMEHLKQPEVVKVDMSVGVSNDTVEDLRAVTRELALQQKKMIESGSVSASDIASSEIIKREKVIEAEFEEIEAEDKSKASKLVGDFYR